MKAHEKILDPIKSFTAIHKILTNKYSKYIVTCGLSKYDHQTKPTWWIELKNPVTNICECCQSVVSKSPSIQSYGFETLNDAILDIDTQLQAREEQ